MTVTTALYRRYRPDSFADVIGQEHVTEPLMTALRKNRVNHAYLFSGPRGCGKTTSARILARCLNCAQGPTDTPCGTCPSCVELARGGSGSLDVIEIDAASHGGVDDARDLRERATYAPVRDRYKIFIIDEAHMVTSAGFNALLKIVEEPPEHIKFIFATTEPDKVIGTIRSRTHHYPFRLVPPEPLMAYLELLCNQENVPVAPGVLSLVIRAGGGSVRDSLSVLDQLMAGAGPNGLDYELAVALLGYTHASLLDDVVEAVAASDAATVFRAVDRVIQTGHDPRRFVEDLLERFRDLIIVQAMPESAQTILRGMPADQIARLKNQAHNLGAAELSRAADVTNTALTEMTGATSPRLHLELLCARILLPSSEQNERGMAARIDRVERRMNYAGNDVGAPATVVPTPGDGAPAGSVVGVAGASRPKAAGHPAAAPPAAAERPAGEPNTTDAARQAAAPSGPARPEPATNGGVPGVTGHAAPDRAIVDRPSASDGTRAPLAAPRVSTNDWPVDSTEGSRPSASRPGVEHPAPGVPAAPHPAAPHPAAAHPEPGQRGGTPASATVPDSASGAPVTPSAQVAPPPPQPEPSPAGPGAASPTPAMGDVEVLRRAWPDVLQTLSKIKRSTWALVEPNAQVGSFDGHSLTLAFTTAGLAGAFGRADHSENLRQAIHKTVGIDCQINAVAGGSSGRASSDPDPKVPASRPPQAASADAAWGLAPAPAPSTVSSPAPAPARDIPSEGAVPPAGAPYPGSSAQPVSAGVPDRAPAGAPTHAAPPAASDPFGGSGGDYSYSDDDWGPPRDEDAPPLDEEPPTDWAPPVRPGHTHSSPSDPAGTPPAAAAPATSPVHAGKPGTEAVTSAAGPSGPAGPAAEAARDPWARAVEQAPGVWVVGDTSNVGSKAGAATPVQEQTDPGAATRYEPAAAQVPPSIPVTKAGATVDAEWGLAPRALPATEPGTSPWGRVPTPAPAPAPAKEPAAVKEPAPAKEPAVVREYAMASAGGAASGPPPATLPARAPAEAPDPASSAGLDSSTGVGTRQSLYQRLSNSPEAEAGRAKAPARAIPAAAPVVQDIPSADDETIEESGVFGRAAVERILGGKLIEERSTDGSPITPRY